MSRRRAVVTGLGVVAPNGTGKDAFWQSLVAGKSAVEKISSFDPTPYPCKVAAEAHGFVPERFMHPRRLAHRGRFSQLAVAAAKLALDDAGIALERQRADRVAVCVGTAMNGIGDVYERAHAGFEERGFQGIPLMDGIEYAPHAPVGHVSVELGLAGHAATVASACATGLDALQWAWLQVRQARADLVLAGSTDAPLATFAFAALCALRILTTWDGPPARACRPFDRERDGLVLGEGAAMFTVEDLDHARARGARIYAELLGFGSGNEGAFRLNPDAAEFALTAAIEGALQEAQVRPHDIDYVCAHGTGLPDADLVETRALKRALGAAAYSIPVSSIKSMIGHAMGAGSALQVAAACLAIEHGIIPPTINLETPDPDCDLDYVPHRARRARVRRVLVDVQAMGGTHAALALGAPPG